MDRPTSVTRECGSAKKSMVHYTDSLSWRGCVEADNDDDDDDAEKEVDSTDHDCSFS